MATRMNISDRGLQLIKHFEGCELKAYRCAAGVITIGYGHTGDDFEGRPLTMGMTISQDEADEYLKLDLAVFCRFINKQDFDIVQEQFDALVSFVYNVGTGNAEGSTLFKLLRKGPEYHREAAKQFLRWNKAGGEVKRGLVRRRQAEMDLFLEGVERRGL